MPTEPTPDIDAASIVRVIAEALDGVSVALCMFDHDLNALHWNRSFLRLFPEHDGHVFVGEHYSRNLRRFYEARLDADELPQIDRYIADGIARCHAQSLPYDFKHRGRWLRVASLPIEGVGGRPGDGPGRIRVWVPIDRPDQAATTLDKLARTERSYAAHIIDDVADGMMLVGPDQRIQAVNDRFLLLYRLANRTDAIGRTYPEVLANCAGDPASPDPAAIAGALLALTDNQRFAGAPFEIPLGGDRWIRVIEQRAADGTMVSTHLDVTEARRLQAQTDAARRQAEAMNDTLIEQARERARAEQALREANEMLLRQQAEIQEANRWLSLAAQIAHVGHWRYELATEQLFWSDEIYRIYGRSKADLVPSLHDPSLTYPPGERERLDAVIARALATSTEFETKLRITRPDGEVRYAVVRGTPQLDESGQTTSFFGVIVDQTEQRRAEEKLRQSEKMQVIGSLAAGVAHDFNNILTVLMGNLALIRRMLPPASAADVYASDALNEAQRGAELTHNLLSYARRQVLSPVRVEVADLIRGQRGFLARTLGAQIMVESDIAPAAPAVIADRAQLQTALMNLAINAAHAMPRGGQLRLTLREVVNDPLGELPPGRYVVITVGDTGSGMAPEVRDRAFDPFFTTKGVDGLGLGLPMVHGFARQSGGDARIHSVLGEGTSVEIWLPAAPEPAARAAPAEHGHVATTNGGARAADGDGKGSILVVDDQPAVLEVVAGILRRAGFAVIEATSGDDALALVAGAGDVDAIVTDYTMPRLTGVEVVQRAQALRPGIPALIITGFAEIADFDASAHGSAIMSKPFRSEALVGAVSQLLARRRATTQPERRLATSAGVSGTA